MANEIKDNHNLMRSVQEACDELDRKEIQNHILKKQKEDAEYVAKITTQANEELVREIRDLNYKSGLYGTSKKYLDARQEDIINNHEFIDNNKECNRVEYHYVREQEPKSHNEEHHCECHQCHCSKDNAHDVNVRVPFFKENRTNFLVGLGIIVVLLLATGFTPAGGFWTAIQDQWITLITDLFKIVLVVIASILIYTGVRKK